MMQDLFLKPKHKKDELLEWIREKKEVKTHEVIAWGLQKYHIRADRDCRDLAAKGLIQRVPKEEKIFRYQNCREDIWRAI